MTNLPDNLRDRLTALTRRNAATCQLLAGILEDRQAGEPEVALVLRARALHKLAAENRRDYLRLQADVIDWELTQSNYTRRDTIVIPDFLPDNF